MKVSVSISSASIAVILSTSVPGSARPNGSAARKSIIPFSVCTAKLPDIS